MRNITDLLLQPIIDLLDICSILLHLPLCFLQLLNHMFALFFESVSKVLLEVVLLPFRFLSDLLSDVFNFLLFLIFHLSFQIIGGTCEGISEHF